MKKALFALVLLALSGCAQKSVEAECQEKPASNVACTLQYDPVCGCNNKTYGNACEAQARGITRFTPGACK